MRSATDPEGDLVTERKPGWRERHKADKRQKAERTGDSPQKRAERKSNGEDAN